MLNSLLIARIVGLFFMAAGLFGVPLAIGDHQFTQDELTNWLETTMLVVMGLGSAFGGLRTFIRGRLTPTSKHAEDPKNPGPPTNPSGTGPAVGVMGTGAGPAVGALLVIMLPLLGACGNTSDAWKVLTADAQPLATTVRPADVQAAAILLCNQWSTFAEGRAGQYNLLAADITAGRVADPEKALHDAEDFGAKSAIVTGFCQHQTTAELGPYLVAQATAALLGMNATLPKRSP